MNIKKVAGSRPPQSKKPRLGGLSILAIMGLIIAAAYISSGGSSPIDPTGPEGPPTLDPYYNPEDYPKQKIILPTGQTDDTKTNLQLKTFNVNNCGQNTAMYFLIDTSGSMKFAGKIGNTKTALKYFVSQLGGKSVIGISTFSKDVKEEIPISYYKDVEKDVNTVINKLPANGWTRTKDGMNLAREKLKEAIETEAYPGYKYNLIIMTDGVPEIPDNPRTCYVTVPDANVASGQRCFAKEQDPRISNLPAEIENLGVGIYAINIYSPSYPSDKALFPYLEALLKEVASDPVDTHYYSSTNAQNLDKVLESVVASICKS